MNLTNKVTYALLLSMGLTFSAAQALAAAGKFEFVTGDVKVKTRAGVEQTVTRGMEINEGDVITSGKPGYAQIRFDDGGIAALQASTVLKIEKFLYKQQDKSKDVVSLDLLKGRLRAITGEVGSVHKENYTIRTPMVQMGVRGTDHEAIFVVLPGLGEAAGAKPGSYNKVNVGGTYIQNEAGRVDVNPAQAAYAGDAKSQPAVMPQIPSIYQSPGADAPKRKSIQVDADGSSPPIVRVLVETPGVGASGGRTGVSLPVDTGFAKPQDVGRNAALGVDWGRWDTATGSTHFINTNNATSASQLAALPGAGNVTATYTYAGGTLPTNELGKTGSVVSATAIANFSTQTLIGYTLNTLTPGRTWNVSGSGSFAQFGSATGIALTGFCAGCATPSAAGRASGQFAGNAAQGLITGYGLQSGTNTASGAMLLTR